MFEIIVEERRRRYREAGLIPVIERPAATFMADFQQWWDPDHNVTFLTPFQSGVDFRNDIQAFFIKPLTCYFLSWYHSGAWLYELALTLIHLVTLDFNNAGIHAVNCVTSVVSIFAYEILFYVEIISNALSLIMRTLMTIGSGLYQAGAYLANQVNGQQEGEIDADGEDAHAHVHHPGQ